ncbi:hypothetical protein TWF679_000326 [Orbilia oligospora]|uniref:Uncharacterized protein n=1 Tax=Orbilia oligospora TaxID=2813651 RepID=A0A8H8VHY0_ORBOL|nr:hypothetical protein TWF679_000326 [Orbilia oligospora]
MATDFASKATQADSNLDDNNNDNDNDNDKENNPQKPSTKKVTESAHNPDDILNPSFIDLFIEEEPPQWTLEDLQQLHVIRGQPSNAVAPFQKLPVELVEHIAYNLTHFRDIRSMANSSANELYFINNIDISAIPHEYVKGGYAYPTSAYYHAPYPRREWDMLYFYKPGKLEEQLLTTPVQIARDGRPAKLIEYAKQTIGNMSSEILQIVKGMGYRYSQYAYYKSGPSVRREKWYAGTVDSLICPAEVVHRMLETLIIQDIGEEWMGRGEYKRIEEPGKLYGSTSAIAEGFGKVDCELQKEPEWLEEFGEDLSNLHECDIECHRKKRATLFKKTWWPRAEKRFVETLVGGNAIQLTDEEVSKLSAANYAWQWRDKMQKIVDGMLLECKWIIPGLSGEWTAETVKEWEKVHGKDGSKSSGYY